RVPLRDVEHIEVERAVGGGVEQRRNPLLIFQLAIYQAIARRAIRNDVFFTDDASAVHAQWLEDALLQEIAIELAGHLADDRANQNVVRIGVDPLLSRSKFRWERLDHLYELFFRVVSAHVHRAAWLGHLVGFVFRKSGSMAQQIAYLDVLPGRRRIGK